MSTQGARGYHAGTFAGLMGATMRDPSAGWSRGGSWRVRDIEAEGLTDEAIKKALEGRDPRVIEPSEYTVVLEPYAVDDLLGSLSSYGMGAQAVQEGRSWMDGIIGQQAMSPLVSIWDDGCDWEGWPVPVDGEGPPAHAPRSPRPGWPTPRPRTRTTPCTNTPPQRTPPAPTASPPAPSPASSARAAC